MRMQSFVRYLLFAIFSLSISITSCRAVGTPIGAAYPQIGFYVSFGPPPIPIYEQPICPGDGYIWVPGYWAWDGDDYYWVPGTWVLAPQVGFFWTPGFWEWGVGGYFFHEGYWGPHVGFYGGINYGFGYFGHGYEGGRWDRGHFFYNRSVNNLDFSVTHNFYDRPIFNNSANRVSYNGGNGGINDRATREEQAYSRERHIPPIASQRQQVEGARGNRDFRASVNQGRPPVAANQRPGVFNDHAVPAREAGGRYEPQANRGANAARPVIHPNDLPPLQQPAAPNTGNPKLDEKYRQQQQKLYNNQNQQRQKLQQQQQKQDQNLTRQNSDASKRQQVEQRHQQQTQQLLQRHVQQQQRMQQKQSPPRQSGPPPGHP
jgi:hypothetical protein